MSADQGKAGSNEEIIRRLSHASQDLAAALSDATRSAVQSQSSSDESASPPKLPEPRVQVGAHRRPGARRAVRVLAWPARRLLDPRFQGLAQQLDQKQIDLFDRLEAHRQEELLHHQAERAVLARLLALLEQLQQVRADPMPESALTPVERPASTAIEAERLPRVSNALPEPVTSSSAELPLPPSAMRELVGDSDPSAFDNPDGTPVFPEIPSHCYQHVFDFGCGCGRVARKLLQQREPPQTYVGIDLHKGMIDWCRTNLEARNSAFQFFHHDVYHRSFNPHGVHPPRVRFPVADERFTFVNAHSVFTHILEDDIPFYLKECARALTPRGVFRSTWFLFDKSLFPMMQEFQNALYINTYDPTNAVIIDNSWLRATLREASLALVGAIPPSIRGFQWTLLMCRARPDVNEIELPEDLAPIGLARSPVGPPAAFNVGL